MAWRGVLRWPAGLVVAALIIPVTGCADSDAGVVGEDPRIIIHDLHNYRIQVPIAGTLVYDPGTKCLYLLERLGGDGRTDGLSDEVIEDLLDRYGEEWSKGLLWPPGTKPIVAEDGRRGVDVPGHGRVLDGDRVEAGGGAPSDPTRYRIPEDCIPGNQAASEGLLMITHFED